MKDNRQFMGVREHSEPLNAFIDGVLLARLADAYRGCRDETKIGDSIDRGLVLLRELNAKGFDVVIRIPTEQETE